MTLPSSEDTSSKKKWHLHWIQNTSEVPVVSGAPLPAPKGWVSRIQSYFQRSRSKPMKA